MSEPELIPCPKCSVDVLVEDLCWCREPICWSCHYDGGHYVPGSDAA